MTDVNKYETLLSKGSVTCKDVAEIAGVAHSTVSRALNNTGYVSPKTKKLVLEIAKKVGYKPSSAARSLVSQKLETIGLITESLVEETSYRSTFMIGASTLLSEKDYRFAIGTVPSGGKTSSVLELPLLDRKCLDGVILDIHQLQGDYEKLVKDIGLPCVLVNPPNPVAYNAVLPDDFSVAYQATDYLIQIGHRNIGYMPRLASFTHGSQFDRMKGYSHAMTQNTFDCIPTWDTPLGRGADEHGIEDEYYISNCMSRIEYYLEKCNCTAVVAYDAKIAARTLVAAYKLGLKVPDDFSLIACDYDSSLKTHICNVTAFKLDRSEIARCAVEMILQLVEDGIKKVNTVYVKGKFIEGDSVVALK